MEHFRRNPWGLVCGQALAQPRLSIWGCCNMPSHCATGMQTSQLLECNFRCNLRLVWQGIIHMMHYFCNSCYCGGNSNNGNNDNSNNSNSNSSSNNNNKPQQQPHTHPLPLLPFSTHVRVHFLCNTAEQHLAPKIRQMHFGELFIFSFQIWQCVKTLYPCSSHQNSWDLWMFIPLKMVLQ